VITPLDAFHNVSLSFEAYSTHKAKKEDRTIPCSSDACPLEVVLELIQPLHAFVEDITRGALHLSNFEIIPEATSFRSFYGLRRRAMVQKPNCFV
jgi:hypothetical protein